MTENAYIQIKDISGRWFTLSTVINTDQNVSKALDSVQKMYKKHARAITATGSVIDIRS